MADPRRIERLASQIREELGALVETRLDDPRIGAVTVTRVRLSRDLGHARVYIIGRDAGWNRQEALAGLMHARGFLRRQLSQRLPHLKRTPELTFSHDRSVEGEMRIEEILARTHDESD